LSRKTDPLLCDCGVNLVCVVLESEIGSYKTGLGLKASLEERRGVVYVFIDSLLRYETNPSFPIHHVDPDTHQDQGNGQAEGQGLEQEG